MGLLDSVVGALGNSQNSGHSNAGLGGLGGLGGLLGGSRGGMPVALIGAVLAMLAKRGSGSGGLSGLVEQFQRGGLGDVVGSWVGTGQNMPVSPSQVENVFGSDMLGQIAARLGVTQDQASSQLAEWLPQTVDQLTPDGSLPNEADGGLGDIGAILGRFEQR